MHSHTRTHTHTDTHTHNVGLICKDSDDVASTKDPQFLSGFQKFCGSQSATPLPTSPLVTPILAYLRLVDLR